MTAVEYNGVYFHSLEFAELHGRNYYGCHLRKTEACRRLGIRLIHVWQDENTDEVLEFLEKVLTGSQSFDGNEMLLPCDRYPLEIPGYSIAEIKKPELVRRSGFLCQNTGWIRFKK